MKRFCDFHTRITTLCMSRNKYFCRSGGGDGEKYNFHPQQTKRIFSKDVYASTNLKITNYYYINYLLSMSLCTLRMAFSFRGGGVSLKLIRT